VRDLMPITEQTAFQVKRKNVEKPFVVSDKYLVFPEVSKTEVTGFYVYGPGKAWYYDEVEEHDQRRQLTDLKSSGEYTLYSLVVQPEGLETLTLSYMPGYRDIETVANGPVVLGSSVLPVVGAIASREAKPFRMIYKNPGDLDETELKKWIFEHSSRRPAAATDIKITRSLAHLYTGQAKTDEQLWEPLREERQLRKHWVQTHNLDENAFRKLSRLLETSCKE
jgi:hypothetical protein